MAKTIMPMHPVSVPCSGRRKRTAEVAATPDRHGIGGEAEAEAEGRESVVLLRDEGRGGDVGEQHALCETELEHVAYEPAVAEHAAETVENVAPGHGAAAFGGEGLAIVPASGKQDETQDQQDAEDALPADSVGQGSADDRGRDGCHAVDCADHGQHAPQFGPRELVGGYRTRDDDAARCGNPLDEPHGDELFDAVRRDAEYGRYQEERHGCEQRPAAAVFVAQRAEEELSDGQSDHAGRQSHLDHRRRSGEESRHRRERRQVHVRDERAEGREHAQQDQQKESRIVVLHVSYLFLNVANVLRIFRL